MAGRVFISYRRDDSAASASYIQERLVRTFGAQNVFMDVDSLLAGQRFDLELGKALALCDVCLAIIGPRWLNILITRASSRKVDYVREEIAGAIGRGIILIPVLVDGATLPAQNQLPADIRALALYQQLEISHKHRGRDVEDLIAAIRAAGKSTKSGSQPWGWIAAGGALGIAAAVLAVALVSGPSLWGTEEPTTGPVQPQSTVSIRPAPNPVQAPGRHFHDDLANGQPCSRCPEMVEVPTGNFIMGSPSTEPGRDAEQEEQVRISLSNAFAVGTSAVTFEQWDACVDDGGCNGYRPSDEGWGRGSRPVINVSYNDAKWYVGWLSRKTGKPYRLLSEAEREYVTRAGTTSPFWWGTSIAPSQANYNGNIVYTGSVTLASATADYRRRTVAVDFFRPNTWGLYNVHGNVWEWTQDCWSPTNGGNPSDGAARLAWADCERHVARGGAWNSDPKFVRSASRSRRSDDYRGNDVGFRVARAVGP